MSKIKPSMFGFDDSEITNPSNDNIEEVVFEFGRVMYKLGRLETDDKASDKEYDKYLKKKEKLVKIIGEFFEK